MVCKNSKKLTLLKKKCLFFFAVMFLLASCASKPAVPKPETFYKGRSDFALMAEGGTLYIHAQVQSVRPILSGLKLGGMTGAELKDFLDMSDVLIAAVFSSAGKQSFYAVALGAFPSTRGGIFFSASKDWESRVSASKIPYWYSSRSRLSVNLGAKHAFIAGGEPRPMSSAGIAYDDPFVPPPGAKEPAALSALKNNSVISGWMNDPAPALNRIIAAFGVPVQIPANRIVFAVYPVLVDNERTSKYKNKTKEDEKYTAILRFETASAAQANALVGVFSMARLGLAMADFSKHKDLETLVRAFFWQVPKADGSALILDTGIMRGEDIALLFNLFSL